MQPTAIHDTFVIERSFARSPEEVFAALADPVRKRRWYADGAHKAEMFEMEFRVGGIERQCWRMDEDTPFPGVALTTEGRHEDIVPDRRVVISTTMSLGDSRITTALVTFELVPTADGTDLIFTHQAVFFENSGGPAMRKAGWEKLLDFLAAEVARSAA